MWKNVISRDSVHNDGQDDYNALYWSQSAAQTPDIPFAIPELSPFRFIWFRALI